MIFNIDDQSRSLSDALAAQGHPLDLRCGGQGTCGRCTVALLTGIWQVGRQCVRAPAKALACKTRLLSRTGTVDVPQNAFAPDSAARVLMDWQDVPQFNPGIQETVVGIDIGTTTLAAAALQGGRIVARASKYNPQSRFGDNVVSRISAAKTHLDDLQNLLLDALKDMLADFPRPARVAVAANSTMTALFHGIDPASMGHAPFTVPKRQFAPLAGTCLGLPESVPVLTVPLISAFLGGDVLAGLHETSPEPGDLFVDIGTNCEMVFCTGADQYTGAAAAAGPAFEGAGIDCGARAIDGAICRYDGPGKFKTIGNAPPAGCCGSAMVDFLAVERADGRLSRFGRFQPEAEKAVIAPGVELSEADIEQLLKAKAAVHAGIASLENHCGAPCRRLVLAGGFARFLNLEHAAKIAMLPSRAAKIVGNTSLAGALRLAERLEIMDELLELQAYVHEVPLNDIPCFEDNFIQGLQLP